MQLGILMAQISENGSTLRMLKSLKWQKIAASSIMLILTQIVT